MTIAGSIRPIYAGRGYARRTFAAHIGLRTMC